MMPKVIYAKGEDSNMFYRVGVPVADPFFFVDMGEKKYVYLDKREFAVFEEHNTDENITAVALEALLAEADAMDDDAPLTHKLALLIFQKNHFDNTDVAVPDNFPLSMADFLRKNGCVVHPQAELYPERAVKTAYEVGEIKNSLAAVYACFDRIKEILMAADIDGDAIVFNGEKVTSAFLKKEVDIVLINHDMANTVGIIVASGAQTAIPHHAGDGLIHPHVPIICDIFPQHRTRRYFADVTRTFFKGEPSAEVRKMYDAVLQAQLAGIATIRPGVKCSEVHRVVSETIEKQGYDVGEKGFIHGTGHSFGLDIHEAPYLNKFTHTEIVAGNILTVEPGLYYPDLGGIRIEDDVLATEDGCENLTKYPKEFFVA